MSIRSSQPRVVVLGAERERWRASERTDREATANGIEAWVHAFGGEYLSTHLARRSDLEHCDIVIADTELGTLQRLAELSDDRPASVKWVTLTEGNLLDYLTPMPHIRAVLDRSDLVDCINVNTLGFFRRLTSARVEYIGIPYPVERVERFIVPFDRRRREAFLCPYLLRRWNDRIVARDIGIPCYGYEHRFHRRLNTLVPALIRGERELTAERYMNRAKELYDDPNLEVRQATGLEEYFPANASAYLWLNLDERYTWGRYLLDAAALRIPIITTRSTTHWRELFPETTVDDAFDLDRAVEIGRRLVNDAEFYRHVATYPEGRLEEFKPERMKRRLLEALE